MLRTPALLCARQLGPARVLPAAFCAPAGQAATATASHYAQAAKERAAELAAAAVEKSKQVRLAVQHWRRAADAERQAAVAAGRGRPALLRVALPAPPPATLQPAQVTRVALEKVGGAMASGGEGLKAASQRIETEGGGGGSAEGSKEAEGGKQSRGEGGSEAAQSNPGMPRSKL